MREHRALRIDHFTNGLINDRGGLGVQPRSSGRSRQSSTTILCGLGEPISHRQHVPISRLTQISGWLFCIGFSVTVGDTFASEVVAESLDKQSAPIGVNPKGNIFGSQTYTDDSPVTQKPVSVIEKVLLTTPDQQAAHRKSSEQTVSSDRKALGQFPLSPTGQEPSKQRVDDSVTVEADQLVGQFDHKVALIGQAQLSGKGSQVQAERIDYDLRTGDIRAFKNISIRYGGHHFKGQYAQINLDRYIGKFEHIHYQLQAPLGHGYAKLAQTTSDGKLLLDDTTYTTCDCAKGKVRDTNGEKLPDWYLKVSNLAIDQYRQTGEAKNATLYFLGTPIMASPYLSFPVNEENHTGLLPPTIGVSTRTGIDVTQPWFYSIAPNRDLTLYPRLLVKRGLQLGLQARYLEPEFAGDLRMEYLRDRSYEQQPNRYAFSWTHRHNLGSGVQFFTDIAKVSDNDYPSDLNYGVHQASQKVFQQTVGVRYDSDRLKLLARMQKFQHLSPVDEPYERPVQLQVQAHVPLGIQKWRWKSLLDYGYFSHSSKVRGSRFVMRQSIENPYYQTGYFIEPKLELQWSYYRLGNVASQSTQIGNRNETTYPTSISKLIPTVSVRAGTYLDREMTFRNKSYGINLEPQVLYVYTPKVDQTTVPVFDSTQLDFGLRQMNTPYGYLGYDRVADNHSLTLGVAARLNDDQLAKTDSLFYFTFLQRYFLSPSSESTTVIGGTEQTTYSDWFMATGIRLPYHWTLQADWQYDFNQSRSIRNAVGLYWRPKAFRRLNIQYRFGQKTLWRDGLKQLDTSFQWSVGPSLNWAGRVNYDFLGRKVVNTVLGMEYQRDCWNFGLMFERYVSSVGKRNNSLFLRLQLLGLSSVGNATHTKLKSNIKDFDSIFEKRIRAQVPLKDGESGDALLSEQYIQNYEIQ